MAKRKWIRVAVELLIVLVFGALAIRVLLLALNLVRENVSESAASVPDPMFAEEGEVAVIATPPPETESVGRDHSAEWDTSIQTPVDRTADELIEEEQKSTGPS